MLIFHLFYRVDDVIDWNKEVKVGRALHVPVCVNTVGKSPIDHFVGVKQRGASASQYKGEKTLRDAFLSLSNYRLSLKQMADRLAQALDEVKPFSNSLSLFLSLSLSLSLSLFN